MTFSDTAMMGLGITQSTNIHKTRSVIRTLKYVLDISQTEGAFTVEEYKHTHSKCLPPLFLSSLSLHFYALHLQSILLKTSLVVPTKLNYKILNIKVG